MHWVVRTERAQTHSCLCDTLQSTDTSSFLASAQCAQTRSDFFDIALALFGVGFRLVREKILRSYARSDLFDAFHQTLDGIARWV